MALYEITDRKQWAEDMYTEFHGNVPNMLVGNVDWDGVADDLLMDFSEEEHGSISVVYDDDDELREWKISNHHKCTGTCEECDIRECPEWNAESADPCYSTPIGVCRSYPSGNDGCEQCRAENEWRVCDLHATYCKRECENTQCWAHARANVEGPRCDEAGYGCIPDGSECRECMKDRGI